MKQNVPPALVQTVIEKGTNEWDRQPILDGNFSPIQVSDANATLARNPF